MKKSLMLILAASIGLTACNNFEKAPSGTLYKVHKSGGSNKIKEGDFVKFQLVQSTDKDSLIFSSYDADQPVVFQVPKKVYAGDMYDVLTFFAEGDSATFKLDIDSMAKYSNQPRPAELKGKYLVFNLKVEKILRKNAGEADTTFPKRAGEFFQKGYLANLQRLKNSEAGRIKAYVADKKLKTTTSASGLQYIIETPGDATRAAMGDTVVVEYTGTVLRNVKKDIFDTSDAKLAKSDRAMQPFQPMKPYGPQPMVVGQLVPGMNEGLMLLGKGAKAKLIIPSNIGFGEQGARPFVGPYTPMAFDVKVTDIKKRVGGAVAPPAPVEAQ